MVDTEAVAKPARKRRARATSKKPEADRKTLATAVAALLLAAADMYLTVRTGIKLF